MHISVFKRDLRTKSSLPSTRLLLGKVNDDVDGDDNDEDDRVRPTGERAGAGGAPEALVPAAVLVEVVATAALGVVLLTQLSASKANCNEDGVVMVGVLGRVVGVLGRGKAVDDEALEGGGDVENIIVVGVLGRGGMLVVGVLMVGRVGSNKRLLRA
jgi:hypothetical protein